MRPERETIQQEIFHSAREWGLCPNDKRHHAFCKEATDDAIASLYPSPYLEEDLQDLYDSLGGSKLSLDLDEAVRFVLQQLLEGAEDRFFVDVTDAIDMRFEPYYRDKKTGEYKRRPAFQRRFTEEDLDPFQRFSAQEMDAADWYYHCWRNKIASLDGSVFEAVVAQYLENHVACASCKFRNSLRWNGGLDKLSSWADVVCIKCHATYEIKSFANVDRVQKSLEYNSVRCGSFKTFYKYHPSGHRYLLLVNRTPTLERGHALMTHRVTIGEIAKVVPRLTDESFIRGGKSIRLKGQAELKLYTVKKIWCSIPVYQGNFVAIAENVYINKYGPEKWNRDGYAETIAESSRVVSNCASVTENDRVEKQKDEKEKNKLLESLAALHLGADVEVDVWDLYCGND